MVLVSSGGGTKDVGLLSLLGGWGNEVGNILSVSYQNTILLKTDYPFSLIG